MINDMFRKMCECSGEERGLSAHNNNCFVYELWRRRRCRRWGAGKVSYSLYIAQEARDVFKIILLLLLSSPATGSGYSTYLY